MLMSQDILSRMSRNAHFSLERRLDNITQSISSLSIQQYSEIAGKIPITVSDMYYCQAAFRTEEGDPTMSYAGISDINPPNPDGSWRKSAWLKRTLRAQRSLMECLLFTVRTESSIKIQTSRETDGLEQHGVQDQFENETSYTVSPATWLIRLGIHHGPRLRCLSSSTQGWKNTLETICPVLDDALIFDFCATGNVPAVRRLLSGGHASVRDTNSRGYTPLHVSISGEFQAA